MGVKIGIDLGTTYSAVARIDPQTLRPVVIRNIFGESTTASALCFQDDGVVLFGEEAKDEFGADNPAAVALFKREMGNDSFQPRILGQTYDATDLSAIFLRLLVADAEKVMGETVEAAVITVPAYFQFPQVKATIDAAKRAGLTVLSTIHEPTAAALAYGLDMADADRTVLFYDLGGGTFDVTIARISGDSITVLGSDGDHKLGGRDWDDALARHIAGLFLDQHGVDLSGPLRAPTAIEGKAEQIKRHLSAKQTISVPYVSDGRRLTVSVTQDDFAEVAAPLCARTLDIISVLMESLDLTWSAIDLIIPVGGSTKMPMIRSYLVEHAGVPVETAVNVDEAVALGAAIKANATGSDVGLLAIGMPRTKTEAPATGFRVTEVVAHALGMIALNERNDAYVNSVIIRKNSTVPVSATRAHTFAASSHNTEMEIYVLQGDFTLPLDNTVINKYVVTDVRSTRREGERIDVTYTYDADGLIIVSAAQDGRVLPVRIDKVPEDMSWAGRPPEQPAQLTGTLVLALDLSGSMSGEPLEAAKRAMIDKFIDNLPPSAELKVGVILFADKTHWLTKPTTNYARLRTGIAGITIGQNGTGYGNDTDPFEVATVLGKDDYLVVLTDGIWSHQAKAVKRAKRLHASAVNVIALGFGGADLAFLKQIATTEDLAGLTDLSRLGESFGRIAQIVQSGSRSIELR